MPNPKRQHDTSYLSADQTDARGIIHRDLIAHALRWSHVARELGKWKRNTAARLLDIGCGKELPLAKTLYSNRLTNVAYLGIDFGPVKPKMNFSGTWIPHYKEQTDAVAYLESAINGMTKSNLTLGEEQDANSMLDALGGVPTHVTCFEVVEHMMPHDVARLLVALNTVIAPGATVWISTPCYDAKVGAAANHINEMTIKTLGTMVEAAGFEVVNRWGTFASQRDYKNKMAATHNVRGLHDGTVYNCDEGFMTALFDRLAAYYDSNLVAALWAPLFPNESRNNLWELRPATQAYSKQFSPELHGLQEHRGQCEDVQSWNLAIARLKMPGLVV